MYNSGFVFRKVKQLSCHLHQRLLRIPKGRTDEGGLSEMVNVVSLLLTIYGKVSKIVD